MSSLQFTQLYEYLAIDSGEYLCTNNLRALIAARLAAPQRSRDGVQLNYFVRSKVLIVRIVYHTI